mgnify:CR=1 FL=1
MFKKSYDWVKYTIRFILIFIILIFFGQNYSIAQFKDVSFNYNNKINQLVKKGVISGYSDNTFRKNKLVTRSEFSKMLSILKNTEKTTKGNMNFSDVSTSHWAYEYIKKLYNEGIINGISKTTFDPEGKINYKQAIKMIIIAFGYKNEAEEFGAYPNGYLKIAKGLGFLDQKNEFGNLLTRDDIVQTFLKLNQLNLKTSNENIYGSELNNKQKEKNNNIHTKNIDLDRVFTVREDGNIEGSFHSKDKIEMLRWIFYDEKDRVIKIESQRNLDILKDINNLNSVYFKDYLKEIDFSKLGKGRFRFKLLVKTSKDFYTVLDTWIIVLDKSEKNIEKYATLNMNFLNISQSTGGQKGHKGTYAIDLVGIDDNRDYLYAPFDGTITKIYSKDNQQNFVWLESSSKLYLADGSYDYITVMTGHDDDISDLYVGKKISRGEGYYKEGESGLATGNHIHLEVAKGNTTKEGWVKNDFDRWHIENKVRPDRVFYLKNSTTIIDSKDIKFKFLNK